MMIRTLKLLLIVAFAAGAALQGMAQAPAQPPASPASAQAPALPQRGGGRLATSETTDSDEIVKWSDTNGDGVADKREVVFTGIGQSGDANIEHQKAGLLWNMDNWIYTTYNPFRIRWTPSGFLREQTGANGGQWGLASDDDGKPWFVDAGGERGPMNFQFPIHYGSFTPCPAPSGRDFRGAAPAPEPP